MRHRHCPARLVAKDHHQIIQARAARCVGHTASDLAGAGRCRQGEGQIGDAPSRDDHSRLAAHAEAAAAQQVARVEDHRVGARRQAGDQVGARCVGEIGAHHAAVVGQHRNAHASHRLPAARHDALDAACDRQGQVHAARKLGRRHRHRAAAGSTVELKRRILRLAGPRAHHVLAAYQAAWHEVATVGAAARCGDKRIVGGAHLDRHTGHALPGRVADCACHAAFANSLGRVRAGQLKACAWQRHASAHERRGSQSANTRPRDDERAHALGAAAPAMRHQAIEARHEATGAINDANIAV